MFMPQDVFNACALTVAQAGASGFDMTKTAHDIAATYGKTYRDEGLAQDVLTAADDALTFIYSVFADGRNDKETRAALACKMLAAAVIKFEVNGKRKGDFFRGAIFHRQKNQLESKVKTFSTDVIAYHFAIVTGKIDPKLLS